LRRPKHSMSEVVEPREEEEGEELDIQTYRKLIMK
jgi:hypothetical protein